MRPDDHDHDHEPPDCDYAGNPDEPCYGQLHFFPLDDSDDPEIGRLCDGHFAFSGLDEL